MWEKGNQKSSVEAEFFWRSGGDSCFLSGIQRLDSENVKVCIAIKIAKSLRVFRTKSCRKERIEWWAPLKSARFCKLKFERAEQR